MTPNDPAATQTWRAILTDLYTRADRPGAHLTNYQVAAQAELARGAFLASLNTGPPLSVAEATARREARL